MPETPKYDNNSQTLAIDADELVFDTLENENGRATVIRFQLHNPHVRPGDMLVVLSGSDIHFHGMISYIEDGWATAADRRGSLLPATVQ
jgi:hypothetical protein